MLRRVNLNSKIKKNERIVAKIWENDEPIGYILLRNDGIGRQVRKKPKSDMALLKLIDNNPYECPFCEKKLSCRQSTLRHAKNHCAVRKLEQLEEKHAENLPNSNEYTDEIKLGKNEYFKCAYPNTDLRDIIFCAAAQGAGKSYWCRSYLDDFMELYCDGNRENNQFEKKHKDWEYADKDVYLLSKIEDDKAFRDLIQNDKVIHIDISDPDLICDPIDGKVELNNSLTIWDDYYSFDKSIGKSLHKTLVELLHNGRSQSGFGDDVFMLITGHQICNYGQTRDILNECSSVVIYPHSGQKYGQKRVMKEYLGYDRHVMNRIFNLDSRWACLHKRSPQYCLAEGEIFIVD